MVEWVGLVAFSFQFLLGLAAVFAEEVGDFTIGRIYWCLATSTFYIHICTFGNKQFGDFLVIVQSRKMQRSPFTPTLRIHIHSSSQVLLDCFNISRHSSNTNVACCTTFTAVSAE